MHRRVEKAARAPFRVGDPISLADMLAMPPDGRRYGRNAQGRLIIVSPDNARYHRYPLSILTRLLGRGLDLRWAVIQEGAVALEPVYSLRGELLPPSQLGPKALAPDLALHEGRPTLLSDTPHGMSYFSPERLRLVIEILSKGTWCSDLGLGRADRVDRWRTYLANAVPEYWVLNADLPNKRLPLRSALFLRNAGAVWEPLTCEGARRGDVAFRDIPTIVSGTIRSQAVPDLAFDLDAYWELAAEILPPEER